MRSIDPARPDETPRVQEASATLDLESIATRTIADGSKSFAAAARLFDAETRRGAILLYTWCRHCDDVIDGQVMGHGQRATGADDARARFARLEADSLAAARGAPPAFPPFRALAEVVRHHAIPETLIRDHLAGYRMDVEESRFRSFNDTLAYCYGVAGCVGVMMARVMGVRDEAVLDRACDLGLAFQLTNIARDLVEDAQAGRCYVPETWLVEVGLTPALFLDGERRVDLARVAARLVDAAEPYYASARIGLAALPPRSAWAVATALGVYRQIGLSVRARGAHAWDARVSTGRTAKLAHVLRGGALTLNARGGHGAARSDMLWTRPRA